ncbi:hypothetical protein GVAV_000478 [Gurleya vavrai]
MLSFSDIAIIGSRLFLETISFYNAKMMYSYTTRISPLLTLYITHSTGTFLFIYDLYKHKLNYKKHVEQSIGISLKLMLGFVLFLSLFYNLCHIPKFYAMNCMSDVSIVSIYGASVLCTYLFSIFVSNAKFDKKGSISLALGLFGMFFLLMNDVNLGKYFSLCSWVITTSIFSGLYGVIFKLCMNQEDKSKRDEIKKNIEINKELKGILNGSHEIRSFYEKGVKRPDLNIYYINDDEISYAKNHGISINEKNEINYQKNHGISFDKKNEIYFQRNHKISYNKNNESSMRDENKAFLKDDDKNSINDENKISFFDRNNFLEKQNGKKNLDFYQNNNLNSSSLETSSGTIIDSNIKVEEEKNVKKIIENFNSYNLMNLETNKLIEKKKTIEKKLKKKDYFFNKEISAETKRKIMFMRHYMSLTGLVTFLFYWPGLLIAKYFSGESMNFPNTSIPIIHLLIATIISLTHNIVYFVIVAAKTPLFAQVSGIILQPTFLFISIIKNKGLGCFTELIGCLMTFISFLMLSDRH